MFVELIYNAALLVTLSVLYGLLSRFRKGNNILYKILIGLLFGLIAVAGMNLPVHFSEGIIYDGRSVILVLAGLFGGGIPSVISIVLSVAFRIYLGGIGTMAGIMTVLVSCSVGLAFRHLFKKEPYRISLAMLWLVGFVAHVFMLTSQLFLPWPFAFEVIKNIWFPIVVVFPVATLIIGILFRSEEKRIVGLEKIKESERLFYTLSENSPVGIFRTNEDGLTIYVNFRWCQIAGISYERALGDGWFDIVHPDDKMMLQENWNLALKNKSNSIQEYRFLKENGQVIWVYGEAKPEYSEDGKISGYIGTITDITERKVSERALIQSEENFRRSMDESPLGVRVVSPDDKTLYVNSAMLRIIGVDNYVDFANQRFSGLYTEESIKYHTLRKEKRLHGYYVPEEYDIEIINLKGEKKYLQVYRKEIFWNGANNFQVMYSDITERKKAEKALTESEKSLNEAEKIARMGSWSFDLVRGNVHWSENCYRVYGFEPFEVEPEVSLVLNKIHPEDRHLFDFEKLAEEKIQEPFDLEFRIQTGDGKYKWLHDRIVLHYDNEQLVMLRGVVRDISDLKEALTALQESERNYRNLFENHSAVKLMIDPISGNIINANYAAANFYGWSVEQLKMMNIHQINILDEKVVTNSLERANVNKNTHFEFKHRLANGEIRDVDVFISKISFQGADCLHLIVQDVTRRRLALDKLKLLSKSVEQNPISIIITDPRGNIEYVNPKFTEVTGYSMSEVMGKNPRILNSGVHSTEFYEKMWETILSGRNWISEIQNKKKNGELYWESVIISPILDDGENITNFIGLQEDISGQKKMINEVVEAKEKAEESERLKSAFLANMSHEIRTPLNAILGFTQMLAFEENLSIEQKEEFTSIINRSAEGLLQIISDILDISQLETGMLKIFKKDIEIQKMLTDIYAQCKLRITENQSREIELMLEVPIDTIHINTDQGRLVQIFMNLLNNSIKFTEKGHIQFGVFHQDDNRIGFFVSDTGIGMAPAIQLHIFDRFRQADESTTRLYGGTGLGLSIVKNLINLMGGEITLESEPNKGTTFRFYLPR